MPGVAAIDGEIRFAESRRESESAESRRDCGVGSVVTKESTGRQLVAIASAIVEEPREWFDGW